MKISTFHTIFKSRRTFENNSGNTTKRSLLSVGLKMMIGVGIVSNLCIGGLLYMNFMTAKQVSGKTGNLLQFTSDMNTNLKSKIVDLQKKYLDIPKQLKVDADASIKEWITTRFTVKKETLVKGRDNYRKLFNRSERRDITKGRFLVQSKENQLVLSKGILDKEGNFTDSVNRIHLVSTSPDQDSQKIKTYIETAIQDASSEDALKQKILNLQSMLADEAIAAETSRNEILYKVEEIEKKKASLVQFKRQKQYSINLIAVAAILLNLVMLHFMAWFLVEKPLRSLTRAIKSITSGETVTIPFQNKKDQIGILAGALKRFQTALTNLKKEDQRKLKEKQIIQELIQNMSLLIEKLQKKATQMKEHAFELNGIAAQTENQTQNATQSAIKTVEQTDAVSYSTSQLQSAVQDISIQITKQNDLVEDINDAITKSRKDIDGLTAASEEINEIVKIVKNIAGETKLLALNARIEAARSGAAGKGFTVVAREVRALSMQTEEANEDIADKIESIQAASSIIIEHTQKIESRIQRLLEASTHISAAVEEQGTVTVGISENAQATSHDIKDVSSRISRVQEAAQTTSRFAQNVQAYSEEIASELSDLLAGTREKLSKIGIADSLSKPEHKYPGSGPARNRMVKIGKAA